MNADQIADELSPELLASNSAIGTTNPRQVKLGDALSGRVRPLVLLTPRDVYYRSSTDQNDRGVAILDPSCPIPLDSVDGYFNLDVIAANIANSSQVRIIGISDEGLLATGGTTPTEQQNRSAAFSSQDQFVLMRLRPDDVSALSIYIDVGLYAIAYEIPIGGYAFLSSGPINLSDPTDAAIFVPTGAALGSDEHRIIGVAFDPSTGQPIAIPGAASVASITPPGTLDDSTRDEFDEADYTAIDFTGYIAAGYIYSYFGQTDFVEDDVLRIFDPRLIIRPYQLRSITSFDVAADSGTPESMTEGSTLNILGGPGISSIVSPTDTITISLNSSRVALTGQTASISATNIVTPAIDGEYLVTVVLTDTTSSVSGGAVLATILYNDENGAQSQSTPSVLLSALGQATSIFTFHARTTAAIRYSTTVSGVIVGSPQYSLFINVTRIS